MPTTLGRYSLEKKIGSGGMADVWLAQGPRGACVVKRPHPHLCGNPDFVRMFLDEATLLAQLHHPGIAEIYELGHVEGAPFLAMEFVPGFDLMAISLEHERHGELMAPELCARIVADVAAALHYAHEAKGSDGRPLHLIHRDVTPHNILLSRQGQVKLIDFGVAKASTTLHRTQAGLVKGKYPYMSPEQIGGLIIDRRVDVYALGLVLYELLTNVRAIPGDTELQQIDAAREGRIRPIEQLRPNVPVPLRQILGGCLHPEVDGRYPTAQAVKDDLEKFLALERKVVGKEDLLRLFRGVAADQGDVSLAERPTELEQPVSDSGVVVLPDRAVSAEQVDELGYSSTVPSMKVLALTPSQADAPATAQIARPSAASPSRGPMLAVGGLSLVVIGLVLALWQPWSRPADEAAVDAGLIPGRLEAFVFPPEDAGPAEEEAVPDAGPPEVAEVRAAVVTVTSAVEADVLVDGQRYGRTPIELELMPGSHTIVVRNPGQGLEKRVVWALEPGERKTLSIAAPLAAVPAAPRKGHLTVNAPPFCSLWVDGKRQPGPAVAVWDVDLAAGSHTVLCTLEDPSLPRPRVKTRKVKIAGGETLRVEFNMATD